MKGFFLIVFLRATEDFSFAALMQLSHGSILLVMFVLLSCIISVTGVVISGLTGQLNNQWMQMRERNSCVNLLYSSKHISQVHTILSFKYEFIDYSSFTQFGKFDQINEE